MLKPYHEYAELIALRKSSLRPALTLVDGLCSRASMREAASGRVTRGMHTSDVARMLSHKHLQIIKIYRLSTFSSFLNCTLMELYSFSTSKSLLFLFYL